MHCDKETFVFFLPGTLEIPCEDFFRSAFGLALSAFGGDPCPLGLSMPRTKEHKLLFTNSVLCRRYAGRTLYSRIYRCYNKDTYG